jgi:hypothetical protein
VANVGHELTGLPRAGKVVKGERVGSVVPYCPAAQAPPQWPTNDTTP